jgi:PKD repeat protein
VQNFRKNLLGTLNLLGTFLATGFVASMALSPTLAHASTDIVLHAAKAPVRAGTWAVVADATAADGFAMANPDKGAPTVATPLASPANYFQMTFPAYAGKAYHLWIRGKAQNNSYKNDSAYVQFSDSVTSAGAAVDRIGTTSAAAVVLQRCTGAPEQGWGWTDNGWCGPGANIQFSTTGTHTIRVQVREDGFSIDQIVLSPQTYLTAAPGVRVNDTKILAANLPPLAAIVSVAPSPISGIAPLAVNFTAKVSGATASSYKWSFGDGQTSTAALPSHIYQAAGNYTASVTVTDTAGGSASASSLIAVNGTTTTQTKFRVVQANISYGGHGTDNIINLSRITDWLIKLNPDAADLTETIGGYNDPALITALMKQKTGITWYSYYVPKYPGCIEGVMILSKWPFVSTEQYFMSYQMPIAEATLNVNGKHVSFFATHFQWPSTAGAERQVEALQLVAFASKFPEPRIIAGDLNAQVYTTELGIILQQYYGGWDTAVAKGLATGYAANPASTDTRTRRSRIDHVLFSKSASVSVTGAEVPDQRAPNTASHVVVKIGTTDDEGVRPSDHNFMEVTFGLN